MGILNNIFKKNPKSDTTHEFSETDFLKKHNETIDNMVNNPQENRRYYANAIADIQKQEMKKDEEQRQRMESLEDISARIRQFDNAPGMSRANQIALEEAKKIKTSLEAISTQKETEKSKEEEYKEKYQPLSDELRAICARIDIDLKLGLGVVTQKEKEKIAILVDRGRKVIPNYDKQDIAIPYILEKRILSIPLNNIETEEFNAFKKRYPDPKLMITAIFTSIKLVREFNESSKNIVFPNCEQFIKENATMYGLNFEQSDTIDIHRYR